jgi:hypothetical protein
MSAMEPVDESEEHSDGQLDPNYKLDDAEQSNLKRDSSLGFRV